MVDTSVLRAKLERNALWVSLGALALAVGFVAVGVQVAPTTFWDRFVWEDIYGPLVVDARQCHTAAACDGLDAIPSVAVKDGYTITSEITYGLVLALLLYGIYVGLFRRFNIVADGWFVLGLMPWIMLGPLARALEDANVFCSWGSVDPRSGQCDPGVFAYAFISPVIYIHIAFYVIGAILLGVFIRERAHRDPRFLTGVVGGVLGAGVIAYWLVATQYAHGFSALVPLWFVVLSAAAATGLFYWRARQGLASVNLTVFVLGVPYALGSIYLIGRWLSGDQWATNEDVDTYLIAGAFILAMAALVAAAVYALSRWLGTSALARRWGEWGAQRSESFQKRLGQAGLIAALAGILLTGVVPALSSLIQSIPSREMLIPLLFFGGLGLLTAFVVVHVGRELSQTPGALLVFAVGLNVALVFAHMIDGLATWVAIEDPLDFGTGGYGGKHPVSEFLMRYWGGFLFPFTKFMMVIVVAWMLDREARTSAAAASLDARNMVGLVKMAIFALGFGPGLRDVLRLSMGV